jgi:hypothetical protein
MMFNRGELPFGSWSQHIKGWIDEKSDSTLFVFYEDLIDNAELELKKIIDFSGIVVDHEAIEVSVKQSSFDKLKKENKSEKAKESQKYLRKGQAGDWTNYFDKTDHQRVVKAHGDIMRQVGYL